MEYASFLGFAIHPAAESSSGCCLPLSYPVNKKHQKGNSEFEIGKLMVMMLLQTTSKKKRTSLMKMISKLTLVNFFKLMIFFWVCWQATESDLTKPSPAKKNKIKL
jgi:hypothetical protein